MYKSFLYLLLISFSCTFISCKNKNYYSNYNNQSIKWKQHQKYLLNITKYQVHGSIICHFYENRKIHLQFFFQNIDCKHYRLVFTDFFGFNNIEIDILENGSYFIRDNIKDTFFAYYFKKLIKKFINEDIIMKNIGKWIIGLPGESNHFFVDYNGYLKKVNYQYDKKRFFLIYEKYYDHKKLTLPKIIGVYYDEVFYCNIKIYKWVMQ